jgi:hypothetical protein
MASGDLTASTPVTCNTPAEILTAINALNLATVTDKLAIIPISMNSWAVFKVQRTA